MRIEHVGSEKAEGRARVTATMIWEDSDRDPSEVFFEAEGVVAPHLESNVHAYLVGALIPAMYFGEKRIRVSEEVCAELLKGLKTNMRWFAYWSGGQLEPLTIECATSRGDRSSRSRKHAASFLSGGIDSLSTLRTNQLDFPRSHGASIHDCIIVHGFDIGGLAGVGKEEAYFDRSIAALEEITRDADVNLISIATNIRLLHEKVHFWMEYFHGAALASVAHALGQRLNRAYIASSLLTSPVPWGSHPLVDPNYGSYGLQIVHDGLHLSRLEKVRRVAEWDAALRNLRVCPMNPETGLNCGVCEKCIRTMLELLAIDKLAGAESFPVQHIDIDLLDTIKLRTDYQVTMYEELMVPLAAAGYDKIVERLQAKLDAYEKRLAWEEERDWKGAVKRFDRKWLNSSLYKVYAAVRPRVVDRLL